MGLPVGFEPTSSAPKAEIIVRYTTGVLITAEYAENSLSIRLGTFLLSF